jgi:amino acid adenylation domain-containing protein/thioester reductase-like protein
MYPEEYIKHIVKDTGALILLTQEKDKRNLEKCLPTGKFVILSIDNPSLKREIFGNTNKENIAVKIKATDLAYVMYTSGSTGVPKGVMIPNRGVIRLVKNTNYIKFEPNDCISQAASISFDAATFEIWGALLNAAKLACADNSVITDSASFADFLQKEHVSIVIFVSAVFDRHAAADPSMFRSLKCLLVGGDVLNVDTIYRVTNCARGSPLHTLNIYGPTENSNCTTIYDIPKNFDIHKTIPIGYPISNTTTYVLDKHLNLMPICIPGELCTGGDGLAIGYLNREDLTKEKFIAVAINEKRVRLYKIGDLARWLPNGNLDYICRIDNQVKIRGFRIELDAIELCLLNSKLINQCAVVVQQDDGKRKTLVAYVVLKQKKNIALLRKFLSKHLPHYMVPNVFIALSSLPKTPNGKVDKKELLQQVKENSYESANYLAPRNGLETKLADIWKELLNLNIVGVTDNFFDIGGYSLLITEMMVKIKEEFNIDFSLPAFLESPTVENLSKLISSKESKFSCSSSIASQFKEDIFLDPKIKPLTQNISKIATNTPKNVLLTGASGFLGAYLLNDLYRLTDSKIYCLVRGKNIDDAKNKLQKTLEKYQLENVLSSDRVKVVLGELSEPNLGIEPSLFDKLAEEVDDIYHCGANVHHIRNYETLRKTNVLSTLEMVKLAVNKKDKRINYVSTLSVITTENVDEDFITENNVNLKKLSGYAQTKLASEIILGKANKQGIPISIYRPSWITESIDSKCYNLHNNHLLLLLKGCTQMGYAPELDANINLLPVDFVSSFIVETSMNNTGNKLTVFNLVNPLCISWNELIQNLRLYGIKMSVIPPLYWYKNYFSKVDAWNAAYPLMSLYLDGGVGWANAQNVFLKVNIENTKLAFNSLKKNKNINESFVRYCISFLKQDYTIKLAN